jgi:hypothetical protein
VLVQNSSLMPTRTRNAVGVRRYNIVTANDLRAAADKLDAAAGTVTGKVAAVEAISGTAQRASP